MINRMFKAVLPLTMFVAVSFGCYAMGDERECLRLQEALNWRNDKANESFMTIDHKQWYPCCAVFLTFASGGRELISSCYGRCSYLSEAWNGESGKHIKQLLGIGSKLSFLHATRENVIVVVLKGDIIFFRTKISGECSPRVKVSKEGCINCACISRDERFIACSFMEGLEPERCGIKIYEIGKTEPVRVIIAYENEVISSMSFSNDKKCIFVMTQVGKIRIRNIETGVLVKTIDACERHDWSDLMTTVDGRHLIFVFSGEFNDIKIWDIESDNPEKWKLVRSIEGSEGGSCLCLTPNEKYIVSGVGSRIKIFSIDTGKCIKSLEGHKYSVRSVCVSPDGRIIASGDARGFIKLWNAPICCYEKTPFNAINKWCIDDFDTLMNKWEKSEGEQKTEPVGGLGFDAKVVCEC